MRTRERIEIIVGVKFRVKGKEEDIGKLKGNKGGGCRIDRGGGPKGGRRGRGARGGGGGGVGENNLEDFKCLDSCYHGKGVARESSRLVHGASRRDLLHDLLLSSIGANRKSSTDNLGHGEEEDEEGRREDGGKGGGRVGGGGGGGRGVYLAHGGEVRSHAEVLLGSPVGDTETGHDLVEDENAAVLVAEGAKTLGRR